MICSACRASLAPGARFCTQCGIPVRTDAISAGADRRVVTALFADLSVRNARSGTADPAGATRALDEWFQALVEPIHRYGGVVDERIGDGILALFGAPLAHEDDAARAVRAGWEIQSLAGQYRQDPERSIGIAPQVRIGIDTGLLSVSAAESAGAADSTVIGVANALARRIEVDEAGGKILVTRETYKLAREFFDFEGMPRIQVEGRARPIEVYRVKGPRPRTERPIEDAERVLGRELELRRLQDAWERARKGRPQVVLLSGDAGIGKSALVRKFLAGAKGDGRIYHARSLSYEQQEAYSLVARLLRGILGLPDYAPSAQVSATLENYLSREFSVEGEAMARLGHLLSLELDSPNARSLAPRQLRSGAFLALGDLVLTLARKGPAILSLEDLHWADPASLEWLATFLERLSDEEAGLPILVLLQARPDADLPDLALDGRFEFTTVALGPLRYDVSLALGALLLGSTEGGLPPQVRAVLARISERAEGNPFFLAEMIRNLEEGGVLARQGASWVVSRPFAEAGLPASVHSAVAARLDRLAPHLQAVIQVAAVMGRKFDARLLREVLGHDPSEALLALIHLKLLAGREGGELSFPQGVIQEVAYESLPPNRRRELHTAVGEALERLLGEDVAKHAATLAQHFERAGDGPQAARYLFLAGRRDLASFANAAAAEHLQAALAWLDRAPPGREPGVGQALPARHDVLLELAVARTALGELDEAMRLLDEVLAAGPASPRVLRVRGDLLERRGDLDAARQAYEKARSAADPLETARATAALANIERRLGRYAEALALSRAAREQFLLLGRPAEAAIVHGIMGICHHRMGEWDAALREHGEAMRLREQAGDADGVARSHNNLGIIAAALGRFSEAHQHYARGLALFRRLGDRLSMAMVLNNLGDLQFKQGDDDLAERHFREALRLSDRYGNAIESMTALGNLAEVFLKRGSGKDALDCIDRCLELAARTRHGEFIPELHCMRGRALGHLGRLDEARRELALARALAAEAGNTAFAQEVDRYEAELVH